MFHWKHTNELENTWKDGLVAYNRTIKGSNDAFFNSMLHDSGNDRRNRLVIILLSGRKKVWVKARHHNDFDGAFFRRALLSLSGCISRCKKMLCLGIPLHA